MPAKRTADDDKLEVNPIRPVPARKKQKTNAMESNSIMSETATNNTTVPAAITAADEPTDVVMET